MIAVTTDKKGMDPETVAVVTTILGYEFNLRILTDPIDADNERVAGSSLKIRAFPLRIAQTWRPLPPFRTSR